jgi:cysteine-rich repeat protein
MRLVLAVIALPIVGCTSTTDRAGGLRINVSETAIDGTFERNGKLVRFSAESLADGDKTVAALEIDAKMLEIALDLGGQTLTENAHGASFDFADRQILVALRDAIGSEGPDVIDSFHGRFLAKTADRFGEVPIGHPMYDKIIPLTSSNTPIPVTNGCGGDGVSCLPGTSGTSAAVFFASGTCQGVSVQYGDSICRGRCGVGCNWFDEDYTWDCLDHDVCLDYSNDCNDEFTEAADDWAATVAPLCWSGSTRSMPPAAPVCGDGTIGLGEQCDDGNKTPGDGCSASCTVETPPPEPTPPPPEPTEPPPPEPTEPPQSGHLVINELEYDQPGIDNAEFVEIYNGSSSPVSLGNLALVFLNASNGVEYLRIPLSGSLPAGGYLVVCPKGATTACAGIAVPDGTLIFNFALATNNIQNGAPDAIALVDLGTGQLVDVLSYEGNTSGVIDGLGSFVLEETCTPSTSDQGAGASSVSRSPNGSDSDGATCDWAIRPLTPGAPNP